MLTRRSLFAAAAALAAAPLVRCKHVWEREQMRHLFRCARCNATRDPDFEVEWMTCEGSVYAMSQRQALVIPQPATATWLQVIQQEMHSKTKILRAHRARLHG